MKCSKPDGSPLARAATASPVPPSARYVYVERQPGSTPARVHSASTAPAVQMIQYFAKFPIGQLWPAARAPAAAPDVSATHVTMRAVPNRRQNQASSGYARYISTSPGNDHGEGFA